MKMLMMVLALMAPLTAAAAADLPRIGEYTEGFERQDGLVPFYWDASGGRLLLEVGVPGEQLLYFNSIASGLGDNQVIGLDKGSPRDEGIIRFERVGPRVHLILENPRFRATEGSEALTRSVADSFPESTLASLDVVAEETGHALVDATPFFLSDVAGVTADLARSEQGSYRLDVARSRIYLPRTRAFPENTEVEVALTFASDEPEGRMRRHAPDPRSVTMRQHHSFVKLPDPGYRPRLFDPRIGVFPVVFYDFSRRFDEGYVVRFAVRHRLVKKDPGAALSKPVKPIVYYLDPAVPEPYRTAFKIGGEWWNRMFREAGFENAFRVEDMPVDMDPLDARYHVIQWLHRTEAGSSVGPSFVDPRTGEIIKAAVRMDSHRSLANYDLYAAMLPALLDGGARPAGEAEEFAMARRRQHSAHEIGHTLGLAHNFAAAFDDRASVMAYPAPLVRLVDGRVDITRAYAPGPGAYDAMVIRWAYSELSRNEEAAGLEGIVAQTRRQGLRFVTNPDERGASSHPEGTTWVNGSDPVDELPRIMELRRVLIDRFDQRAIREGQPMSLLWRRLTSVYLYHLTTLQAAIKAVGGMEFDYAVRGDPLPPTRLVAVARERRALEAVLDTLEPEALEIPDSTLELLAPAAFGHGRDEFALGSPAAPAFDQLAAARVAATQAVSGLLAPERTARVAAFKQRDPARLGLVELVERIIERTGAPATGTRAALRRVAQRAVIDGLIDLAAHAAATTESRAAAQWGLRRLSEQLEGGADAGVEAEAHADLARRDIARFLENGETPPRPAESGMPRRISLGDVPYCSIGALER